MKKLKLREVKQVAQNQIIESKFHPRSIWLLFSLLQSLWKHLLKQWEIASHPRKFSKFRILQVFIISSLTLWGRLVSTGRRIAVIAVAIVLILTQHPGVEFKCRPLLCHALCLSICYLQRPPIPQDVKMDHIF